MKRYIFTQTLSSPLKGFNRTVKVYKLRSRRFPEFIGANAKLHEGTWIGAQGEAVKLICDKTNYKNDGYYFINKNVELQEL